jgi:hypothetical protein
MMAEQPKNEGGRPKTGLPKNPVSDAPTLAQVGIDKNLANRARNAAKLTEDQFEARVAEAKNKASASVKIGQPKKPKKDRPPARKPDEVQRQASINVRPEDWDRFKEQAAKEGVSAAAKLGAVLADPEVDPCSLTTSSRASATTAMVARQAKAAPDSGG